MATVATRQEKNLVQQKYKRIDLTPTGLLMEAYYTPSKILSRNLDELGRKLVYGGDRYLIAELA